MQKLQEFQVKIFLLKHDSHRPPVVVTIEAANLHG